MTVRVSDIQAQGPFMGTARWAGVTAADPPAGSGTMTRAFVAVRRKLGAVASAINFIAHSNNTITTGWRIIGTTSNASMIIQSRVATTTGEQIVASTLATLRVFFEPLLIVTSSFGGGTHRLRVNGIDYTAATTGTYIAAAQVLAIGARSGSNDQQLRSHAVAVFIGSDTVALDAAGLAALELRIRDQLQNGRRFTGLVPNDVVYDARDVSGALWPSAAGAAVAGVTLTRTGLVARCDVQARPTPL